MMSPPRRKKWSEAEEETLIDRYGEMASAGDFAKMKTRERKFRPIAVHVNRMHHDRDPVSYPWQWSWKDVSTKVQNMRHQYLLVKQKIRKPEFSIGDEEYDWPDGVSYWSSFLRYKDVFGDVPLSNDPVPGPSTRSEEVTEFGNLDLEQADEEEMDRERQERKRLTRQWREEWEAVEKESREGERRRREARAVQEREWEEKMNTRRSEWTKRMDEMMNRHRAEMGQLQSRILNDQQNLASQLLGMVSQWSGGHTSSLSVSDHSSTANHYLMQMMHSLHHANGLVPDDTRVEGDNQDDHFIVDG